jgi:hypothetical protein
MHQRRGLMTTTIIDELLPVSSVSQRSHRLQEATNILARLPLVALVEKVRLKDPRPPQHGL